MKWLAAFTLSLLVGGCNSTGDSDYSQFYRALRQSIGASFGQGRITKSQAAAIPYASMGYRLNDGMEQLLVLATDSNDEQLWTSASHVVIATRGGRIVRTVGLPTNVSAVTPAVGQAIPLLSASLSGTVSYSRLADLPDNRIYGAALACKLVYRGRQTIVILGRGLTTIKIDENCASKALNWTFTDSYWMDVDNRLVWKSIQHIGPEKGKIETEILRDASLGGTDNDRGVLRREMELHWIASIFGVEILDHFRDYSTLAAVQ